MLAKALLEAGHVVTILDNFMYGQVSLFDGCSNERIEVLRGYCRDEDTVRKLAKDADLILR